MHWLLTSTTYGTWLPGDRRGSVTSVRDRRAGDCLTASRVEHDRPGQPYEAPIPGLSRSTECVLRAAPVLLTVDQAIALRDQFVETARVRGWPLLAAAVMSNHFHLVVEAGEEVASTKLLGAFKAWGSRALSEQSGKRSAGRWFTTGGSRRPLRDPHAVSSAINYVLQRQSSVLAVYDKQPTSASE